MNGSWSKVGLVGQILKYNFFCPKVYPLPSPQAKCRFMMALESWRWCAVVSVPDPLAVEWEGEAVQVRQGWWWWWFWLLMMMMMMMILLVRGAWGQEVGLTPRPPLPRPTAFLTLSLRRDRHHHHLSQIHPHNTIIAYSRQGLADVSLCASSAQLWRQEVRIKRYKQTDRPLRKWSFFVTHKQTLHPNIYYQLRSAICHNIHFYRFLLAFSFPQACFTAYR